MCGVATIGRVTLLVLAVVCEDAAWAVVVILDFAGMTVPAGVDKAAHANLVTQLPAGDILAHVADNAGNLVPAGYCSYLSAKGTI